MHRTSQDRPQGGIAIIGAGLSGASLALQLLASAKRGAPVIHLIERSGRFGPGLAYATSFPGHVMNVRAAKLSLFPDQPDHFVQWLSARLDRHTPDSRFAERAAYGEYLEVHLRHAANACEPGAFNFVRETAIAVTPHKSGADITLASGAKLHVDAVVLALGNQPAAPFPSCTPDVAEDVLSPWDPNLARIRNDADVLILGTGLTMVDAMLRIASAPRTGKVFALSRHGLLPQRHAMAETHDERPFWVEGRHLSDMLRQFRAEISATMARGEPWQNVFDRFRPETVDLWMSLPLTTKRRFLRHLRAYWDVHRHRAPPHIRGWIGALNDTGALDILSGRIVRAARSKNGFDVFYRPRGAQTETRLEVAHIINCTGPSADLAQSSDPLLRQVLDDGIGRPHATGLGLDVAFNGRLVDAQGAAQSRVFALGPLAQGAFWETTAAPEIRANAAAMAQTLLSLKRRAPAPAASERVVPLRATRSALGERIAPPL